MPVITIEGGHLSPKQKQQLIEKLTTVASEVMEIPDEFFTVTIKELSDDNIGIGGKSIGTLKAEYQNPK